MSDAIRDTGRRLAALPADQFTHALSAALADLFPAFSVGFGSIYDATGMRVEVPTIIAARPIQNTEVPADAAACAAYICWSLDAKALGEAYELIARVKALQKPPSASDRSTVTLGLIVAANSTLSLDKLAEEMRLLNAQIPFDHRPDMVTVLTRGVINYACRLSGDTGLGDWMPPQPGSRSWVPPVLLSIVTTATTTFSLNRLVGYIIGHMAFFAPSLARPDFQEVIADVPGIRNIVATCQPNLLGTFVEIDEPEPILRPPFVVEGPQGELLTRLYYQPWQDGGVILSEGQLPLDALIPFIPRKIEMVFKPKPDRQLTQVLPLSHQDFMAMAKEITKRSNLKVHVPKQQFTIAKMMDAGTETPFVARLWMTPLNLRDTVLGNDRAKIDEFDAVYQSILNDVTALRRLGKETLDLWKAHEQKVRGGQIARIKSGMVEIDETIDEPLLHKIETIIKNAASTIKQFQFMTKVFGIDTGFLYQKPPNFKIGIDTLEQTDNALADYLRESRKWIEPVIKLRDDMEHAPYVAPRIGYAIMPDGGVRVVETHVMGMPLSSFVTTLLSRLNRYVEDVLMWCIQRTAAPLVVTEIPLAIRDPQKPERFRLEPAAQAQPWVIIYSDDEFDRI